MSEIKPPYQDLQSNNPENRHPCTKVWRALLWLGGALTFIRNFIANTVMLLIVLLAVIAIQAVNSFKDEATAVISGQGSLEPLVPNAEILYLPLSGSIAEIPFGSSQFAAIYRELNANLSGQDEHDLQAIEQALTFAAYDDDIKYVLLDLEGLGPISQSMAERIGQKLQLLKTEGKETAVTATTYSQGAYLIAVNAQQIYLDPLGAIDLKGIALSSLYFKGLIDNLKLTPYIFRAGHFKSAVEPFTRDSMSPDVKAEYQQLAQGLWQQYERALEVRQPLRGTTVLPEASAFIAALERYHGDTALMQKEMGLVDSLKSKAELLSDLSRRFGQSTHDRFMPQLVDYRDYLNLFTQESGPQDQIAVVYGVGEIIKQGQTALDFSADNIIGVLNDLGQNPAVKAIVLYINSPGGMADASEQMRRKLERLRNNGVKVVTAIQGMGASGAYWTATASDEIIATPSSLIGSIGVFSIGVGAHELLNSLGVYQDGTATHEFATMPAAEPMNPAQQQRLALSVEHTYKTFIDLVSVSRRLNPSDYQTYAEGQVFLADEAKMLGLIDDVGTLEDAIAKAAALAGGSVDDFSIVPALPQTDERLSALERFIFRRAAAYLPSDALQLLLTLTQGSAGALGAETAARGQLELLGPLQEPLL